MTDVFHNLHPVSVGGGWTAAEWTVALIALAGLFMAAHVWRL
jgi:hypothetical protein